MRAPLRFAVPPKRTSQHGVPLRSEATASRRVAVKSSALGSPHNSPMTAERPEHLTPSSIAHSASRASRVSTWTMAWFGNPGGWIRPLSRIAMRSWTHSKGLSRSSCGSRKPVQPPSRGCAANSSERVGCGGRGNCQYSCERRDAVWAPAFAGAQSTAGPERVETAPPATRDRPLATRLTTFLFYFCSFSRESGMRVKRATRPTSLSARSEAALRCRSGRSRPPTQSG